MTAPGRSPPRPLRPQWAVGVCLGLALAAAGIGEWLARENAAWARDAAGGRLLALADELADRLSQEMAARTRDVQALADNGAVGPAVDPATRRATLETLQRSVPQFSWIGLTDAEGRVVAATGGLLEGQSIAARPVFQNGRSGLWSGDVHQAVLLADLLPHPPGEDVKFVDVATPLRGADGTPAGVLAAHLSWQWAVQLRQTVLRPRGGMPSVQLAILDKQGEVLLPPDNAPPQLALPAAAVAGLTDRWAVATWNDRQAVLTAAAASLPLGEFKGFGWRVVARDPAATARTSVEAARPEAYAWTFGAAAVIALLALGALGRRPARPAGGAPQAVMRRNAEAVRPQRRTDGAPTTRPQAIAPPAPPTDDRRDGLTGLGNARLLDDVIGALPRPDPQLPHTVEVCVLGIDLDHFAAVNDRYGHAAGNEVLVQVARRLRQAAREHDNVFRLHDDDFLVLLTCPAGEGAALVRALGARVLTELQRPLSYRTLSNLRISASVGGAVWPLHGETVHDAVARAHDALRAAKQSGTGKFRLAAGAPDVRHLPV